MQNYESWQEISAQTPQYLQWTMFSNRKLLLLCRFGLISFKRNKSEMGVKRAD